MGSCRVGYRWSERGQRVLSINHPLRCNRQDPEPAIASRARCGIAAAGSGGATSDVSSRVMQRANTCLAPPRGLKPTFKKGLALCGLRVLQLLPLCVRVACTHSPLMQSEPTPLFSIFSGWERRAPPVTFRPESRAKDAADAWKECVDPVVHGVHSTAPTLRSIAI
jgi:hypothetical protein